MSTSRKLYIAGSVVLVLGFAPLLFVSSPKTNQTYANTQDFTDIKKIITGNRQIDVHIMEIDGCQYIVCLSGAMAVVHKANCKNPIHANNKQVP